MKDKFTVNLKNSFDLSDFRARLMLRMSYRMIFSFFLYSFFLSFFLYVLFVCCCFVVLLFCFFILFFAF